jgi:hypothetical protein
MAINFTGDEQTHASIPLQVQTQTKKDTFTRSGAMGTVTGLYAQITPSSSNSKILILVSLHGQGNGGQRLCYGLRRDRASDSSSVTDDFSGNAAGSRTRAIGSVYPEGGNSQHSMGFITVDAPSTTSQLTYYVLVGAEGSQPFYLNYSEDDSDSATVHRTASSITVMEFGS